MTRVEFDAKVNSAQMAAEVEKALVQGLRQGLLHVLGTSNHRVPHLSGDLERSGAISVDRSRLIGAISYDTPYAVIQHESLDFKHSMPGRTAKFLELAIREEAEAVKLMIAKQLREVFK